MTYVINVKDFSIYPGARYRINGPKSGEEFFEDVLLPAFQKLKDNDILCINLDGTLGYPPSFLSESFGRLYHNFGQEKIWKKLQLISKDDPLLISSIHNKAKEYA